MSYIKKLWKTGDIVLPDDLNRYENGIDDLYKNKANSTDIGLLSQLTTAVKTSIVNAINSLVTAINNHDKNTTAHQDIRAETNELGKQITVLNDDRGYLNTKLYDASTNSDLNTFLKNGKYAIQNPINAPIVFSGWGILEVTQVTDGYVKQTFTIAEYGANGSSIGKIYTRSSNNKAWSVWNSLDDKIGNLSEKSVTFEGTLDGSGDLNLCTKVNKYYHIGNSVGVLNLPPFQVALNNSTLYVYGRADTILTQILFASEVDKIYKRRLMGWGTPKWSEWKEIATTDKINISSYLVNGWRVVGECAITLMTTGDQATIEGIITNDSTSYYVTSPLSIIPCDGKYHAGTATYFDGTSSYVVLTPDGKIWFQNGHKTGVYCAILISYPIN